MIKLDRGTKILSANQYCEISKLPEININVDTKLIDNDIFELADKNNRYTGKADKINVQALSTVLKAIRLKAKNSDSISVYWVIESGCAESKPIKLCKYDEYDIDTSRYIVLKPGQRIVRLDYTRLIDAMAFEMAHRDFGYDTKEIDEMLTLIKIPIVGVADGHVLTDFFKEEGYAPYITAKSTKIKNSCYKHYDGGDVIDDYYMSKSFKCKVRSGGKYESSYYYPVLKLSASETMTLILNGIIPSLKKTGMNIMVINVGETEIAMIVDNHGANVIRSSDLDLRASIRLFGRQLFFEPDVIL